MSKETERVVEEDFDFEAAPTDLNCDTKYKTPTLTNLRDWHNRGQIKKPFVQRKFVWPDQKQRAYIVTLLLRGLSPSLMLVLDPDAKPEERELRYILDGHQRLSTIVRFMKNDLTLDDEIPELKGLTYSRLPLLYKNRFDFLELQISESIVQRKYWGFLFRRINKGGMILTDQEIRRAVFNHASLRLIEDVTEKHPWWLTLFGPNTRYRGTQSALRAYVMHREYSEYTKPMNMFLDNFCYRLLTKKVKVERDLGGRFDQILTSLHEGIGRPAFRVSDEKSKPVNLGLLDVVMHAGFLALEHDINISNKALQKVLIGARNHALNTESIRITFEKNTSGRDSVLTRMSEIETYMAGVLK